MTTLAGTAPWHTATMNVSDAAGATDFTDVGFMAPRIKTTLALEATIDSILSEKEKVADVGATGADGFAGALFAEVEAGVLFDEEAFARSATPRNVAMLSG